MAETASSTRLLLNGAPTSVPGRTTVARLLSERGLAIDRVAVEVNRTIVAKQDYAQRELADGDVVEIVSFVGGG